MVDIMAQKPRTVQAKQTGTASRSAAVQGLRDFVTGLVDFRDEGTWTSLDDLHTAYERWVCSNRPGFVLGRRQFAAELKAATFAGTSQRGGQTGFRFVTLHPQAA